MRRPPSSASAGALAGIRIVDMTRVLAGPTATSVLGDMGADVIKVERPCSGDDTRKWGPPWLDGKEGGESTYFLSTNRNKRSVSIDWRSVDGARVLRELIASADVVVENYIPGALKRRGFDYKSLLDADPVANRGLVYCSITGFGPTGPMAAEPGYAVMVEAMCGLMSITGSPDGEPVKCGVAMTDLLTGLYAHGAITAALLARERNGGTGQLIDCSLFESQLASLANIGQNYLSSVDREIAAAAPARRWGTAHPSIVPYQAFATRDGRIVIGANNDSQWQALCGALAMPALLSDERFATNALRVEHREALIAILSDALCQAPTASWLPLLLEAKVPHGALNTVGAAFELPQAAHREMVVDVPYTNEAGEHTTLSLAGPAVKFSKNPTSIRLPPPKLGEHTNEILREVLGYDDAEIERLRQRDAVGGLIFR